jgi:NADPH:quinone reductase-like Zn-dependent oxidoreductase
VRVLQPDATGTVRTGDVCMVMPFGRRDRHGYAELVYAYDMPGTYGLLARRTKVAADLLLQVPDDARYTLAQWATYARYFSAWDNWRVAFASWRAQMPDADPADHLVFGWGGGVALAELELARRAGFRVAMTAGSDDRLSYLAARGITPVDRRVFPDLAFDADRAVADQQYADRYRASEKGFLRVLGELSDGAGAAIFVDNLGGSLIKPTLKAIARQGVLTTLGWKHGMEIPMRRASECIRRHLHINTHVWRYQDSAQIRDYQLNTGWLPDPHTIEVRSFDDVPGLADDFAAGRTTSYFPLYRIEAP